MDMFDGLDIFDLTGKASTVMARTGALIDKLPTPTYQMDLGALLVLCATLFFAQREQPTAGRKSRPDGDAPAKEKSGSATSLQLPFLVVYSLVMGSDWLQGPFLYSLYRDEHGISPDMISSLFTAGFLSGAASGYFVGTVADRRGRKAACLFFCGVYALSCILTTLPHVALLLAGRVLGGLGTSLLFSVFESWMVADFRARGLAEKGADLSRTFGLMSTLNSLVAIASGLASEWLVGVAGTRKAPFAASVALLVVAVWVIQTQWAENYGESGSATKSKEAEQQKQGESSKLWATLTNPEILTLGLASTIFEGSMYLFVFYWAPALQAVQTRSPSGDTQDLPYGVIFASFMASVLAASLLFNALMARRTLRHSELMVAIAGTANVCFYLFPRARSEQPAFWLFCLFEACVGLYWPCMGYLRGRAVDDAVRAQVYGLLRVPLNLFVVASLVLTAAAEGDAYKVVFTTCSKLLLMAFGALGFMAFKGEPPQY